MIIPVTENLPETSRQESRRQRMPRPWFLSVPPFCQLSMEELLSLEIPLVLRMSLMHVRAPFFHLEPCSYPYSTAYHEVLRHPPLSDLASSMSSPRHLVIPSGLYEHPWAHFHRFAHYVRTRWPRVWDYINVVGMAMHFRTWHKECLIVSGSPPPIKFGRLLQVFQFPLDTSFLQ